MNAKHIAEIIHLFYGFTPENARDVKSSADLTEVTSSILRVVVYERASYQVVLTATFDAAAGVKNALDSAIGLIDSQFSNYELALASHYGGMRR